MGTHFSYFIILVQDRICYTFKVEVFQVTAPTYFSHSMQNIAQVMKVKSRSIYCICHSFIPRPQGRSLGMSLYMPHSWIFYTLLLTSSVKALFECRKSLSLYSVPSYPALPYGVHVCVGTCSGSMYYIAVVQGLIDK